MGLYATPPVTGVAAPAETNLQTNQGPRQERTLNQDVVAAVHKLNQVNYTGENREVRYSVEPGTHKPVIQVVNKQTNEVITQWPPEYVLQLAAEQTGKVRDTE